MRLGFDTCARNDNRPNHLYARTHLTVVLDIYKASRRLIYITRV